jgi:hypothetical protein
MERGQNGLWWCKWIVSQLIPRASISLNIWYIRTNPKASSAERRWRTSTPPVYCFFSWDDALAFPGVEGGLPDERKSESGVAAGLIIKTSA